MTQFDLFEQPSPQAAKTHASQEHFPKWTAPEGPPEYRAMVEMLHFIDYLKLNDWQQRVFWPHVMTIKASLEGVTSHDRLRFELGYVVGSLEVEQLRTRSASLEIARKYGVEF